MRKSLTLILCLIAVNCFAQNHINTRWILLDSLIFRGDHSKFTTATGGGADTSTIYASKIWANGRFAVKGSGTEPLYLASVAYHITAADTVKWNLFKSSVAYLITAADTVAWNLFKSSVAYHITTSDTNKWNNYNNSVASKITASDTNKWNNYNNSVASKITASDTAKWDTLYKNISISNFTYGHTLTAADNGKFLVFNKNSADSLIIPSNASSNLTIGFNVTFEEIGTGTLTVYITSDNLQSPGGKVSLNLQYDQGSLIKRTSTIWSLTGSLK